MRYKKAAFLSSALILTALTGFLISSGILSDILKKTWGVVESEMVYCINYHMHKIGNYPDAKRFFLLPDSSYLKFYTEGLSFGMFLTMLTNAVLNFLFQPVFLCVFTPQAILIYALFPFFIYGAIKFFKKVPIMILLFAVFAAYIGMKDSIVEPLIRHRMSCELIYILIGLAGFVSWTTESS